MVIFGVCAGLSTSSPNFSKAEIRTQQQFAFTDLTISDVSMRLTHQLLEELNSTVLTSPKFPPEQRFQRS
jgi:hypothetical protein